MSSLAHMKYKRLLIIDKGLHMHTESQAPQRTLQQNEQIVRDYIEQKIKGAFPPPISSELKIETTSPASDDNNRWRIKITSENPEFNKMDFTTKNGRKIRENIEKALKQDLPLSKAESITMNICTVYRNENKSRLEGSIIGSAENLAAQISGDMNNYISAGTSARGR